MNEAGRPSARVIDGFGGSIRPADWSAYSRRLPPLPREYCEIVSPLTGTRHRADTPFQAWKLANRIGASRYTLFAIDGKRMVFDRAGDKWQCSAVHGGPRMEEPMLEPPRADPALGARGADLLRRVEQRYVIERRPYDLDDPSGGVIEYRSKEPRGTVAFDETRRHVSTPNSLPWVARSMIDVAELRGYGDLRVSGDRPFEREVWLEASLRGMKVEGYVPTPVDFEKLQVERAARGRGHVAPMQAIGPAGTARDAARSSTHGGRARKSVMAAIDAVLLARHVPDNHRAAVLDAAERQLAQRVREGKALPKVRVYDPSAPSQRPAVVKAPEPQLTREQAPRTR